jgi:hypothetical protein
MAYPREMIGYSGDRHCQIRFVGSILAKSALQFLTLPKNVPECRESLKGIDTIRLYPTLRLGAIPLVGLIPIYWLYDLRCHLEEMSR